METLEDRCLLSLSVPTAIPLNGFLTGPAPGQPLDIALGYLAAHGEALGVTQADLTRLFVTDMYTDADIGTTHIYLRQGFDGIQVRDANVNLNISGLGEVIDVGGGFVQGLGLKPSADQPPVPGLSAVEAVKAAAADLGLVLTAVPTELNARGDVSRSTTVRAPGASLDDVPVHLQFVPTSDTTVALGWDVVLRTPDGNNWYDVDVDAATGKLLWQDNWVENFNDGASYRVFAQPTHTRNPDDGPRTVQTNPSFTAASPFGWHDTNGSTGAEFTDTRGNNTNAHEDRSASDNGNGVRPDGGKSLKFDFPLDLSKSPVNYTDAATTNLFYWTNVIHDIHYRYGFTEAAGNFQVNDYGNGGIGGDPVDAEAQDGAQTNNANMFTPPDGQSPRLQMFEFDLTSPNRDGDLESEIMVHEFGHGVSNRLTGGPANVSALRALQSGGMGEGWSDWWALMFVQKPTDTQNGANPSGTYVLGQPLNGPGIRRFPYSFDKTIDPLTFNDFNGGFPNNEVHNTGEIWCSTLWDLNWLLINKYGYTPDLYNGNAGNTLALQLVMDALKLQPVNPSFLDARNAILSADQARTGGANQFEIWSAFARRGLGLSATTTGANDTVVVPAIDIPVLLQVNPVALTGVSEGRPISNAVVAHIVDTAPGPIANYSASISWGDGFVTPGAVVSNPNGGFDVLGTHTYDEGGRYTLRVTGSKVGGLSGSVTTQVTVANSPITLTGGQSFSLVEGDPFLGTVASFIDADPTLRGPNDYTITIDWGDGTTTAGTATPKGNNSFDVIGNRSNLDEGSLTITVTVTDKGGESDSGTSSAVVSDAPITATAGLALNLTEGVTFTRAVASLVDGNLNALAADFSVQIDWGDGTVSAGTAVPTGSGRFDIVGSHFYEEGSYTITVNVADKGGSVSSTTTSANVTDAPIVAVGRTFAPLEGVTFSGVIATLTDGNPRARTSDFTVTVDWGDGTTTPGTLTAKGNGLFDVKGTKAYPQVGNYPVRISINDRGGSTSQANGTAAVADAPLFAVGSLINQTEGAPFTTVVATFTDLNPLAQASDFTAIIDWGDGTSTAGTVVANASGGFDVLGSHSFDRGAPLLSITINDVAGASASAAGTALVKDAPLTGTSAIVTATEFVPATDLNLGSFTDANPKSKLSEFTAVVDWGDGTSSNATLVPLGNGGYTILGSHTFSESGTYPVNITVNDVGGSSTVVHSTSNVIDFDFPITGRLNPASDSGLSQSDNITNVTQPNLFGTAEPNTTVKLYAQAAGQPSPVLVGTGPADSNGAWSIATDALPDGRYSITATSTDAAGNTSAVKQLLPSASQSPLVIDTIGPRVVSSVLDPRRGQISINLQDDLGDLSLITLLNAANYSLASNGGINRTFALTKLTVSPNTPTNVATVVATFNRGRRINAGSYVFTISAAGLTDLAGNPLVERVFVAFPQLNYQSGGNYIAQFDTDGRILTLPQIAALSADRFNRTLRNRARVRVLS